MKSVLGILVGITALASTHALQISEIMSNPTGDDSGREWLEIYNNSDEAVDIASLTISIKGGSPDIITPVSGGITIQSRGYAVIGSTVSGQTRLTQDYSTFNGLLFKSSISLVNTGVTSLSISLNGQVADTLSSYTAAKEGKTFALISGGFSSGTPTPGETNQQAPVEVQLSGSGSSGSSATLRSSSGSSSSGESQSIQSVTQAIPTEDIIIVLPNEKIVIAGAETEFIVKATTRSGKSVPNVTYTWAFGDGGQGTGSSTKYTYAYTGRYIAQVEANTGNISPSTGRMVVRVVSPDITIDAVGKDGHGVFVDITNPNPYELGLSQWKITFDGSAFPFPKNTVLAASSTTRFSGTAMGFGTVPFSASSTIKILFPHLEEVTRYKSRTPSEEKVVESSIKSLPVLTKQNLFLSAKKQITASKVIKPASTTDQVATTTRRIAQTTKDTRLVSWVRYLLGK